MSNFRVCKVKTSGIKDFNEFIKFDDKQDAEHYAKNQSLADNTHGYEIQKNMDGDFTTIKSYLNGQVS